MTVYFETLTIYKKVSYENAKEKGAPKIKLKLKILTSYPKKVKMKSFDFCFAVVFFSASIFCFAVVFFSIL